MPGEAVEDFLRAAQEANAIQLTVTGNYLGESEHDERTAKDAVGAYLRILDGIIARDLKGNISVKPTQVGLEIGKAFFKENLRLLLDRAKEHDIFIRWDMESSEWTQATLDPFEELACLAMECRLLDGGWAGDIFLRRGAAALGGAPRSVKYRDAQDRTCTHPLTCRSFHVTFTFGPSPHRQTGSAAIRSREPRISTGSRRRACGT